MKTTLRYSQRSAGPAPGALAYDASPLSLRYKAKNLVAEGSLCGKRALSFCRALNVVVAAVGIVITFPLMLMIAMAIKLSSRGPVVYSQPRVGLDRRRGSDSSSIRRDADRGGRVFTIYKFRTMRPDDGSPQQTWASQSDPRITLIGRFLRATRLDELPQFFNVLLGDMNIVGPRPEQPDLFAEIQNELGRKYRRRQKVLPGITGLAQVSLGYDTDIAGVERKLAKDMEYISEQSPVRDLEIMLKTVPVMVFRKVWM
jgi:lipopolysaccharide/colanic/teichoic acid biosynthesis glycosyltransferase